MIYSIWANQLPSPPDVWRGHRCNPRWRKMLLRLFYLALAILLAPLFYAFTLKGVQFLVSVFTFDSAKWFLLGAALAVPVSLVMLGRSLAFIRHLLHELEHAALAFLFTFQLPQSMQVNPAEGSEVRVPRRGGCLVALAPYYLPLLTIPLLLFKALAALVFSLLQMPLPAWLAIVLDLLIGLTLVFHYITSLREFRLSQPDIKETGLLPSIVGVLFTSFIFLVLSVTVVVGSYAEFLDFLKASLATTVDTYAAVFGFVKTHLLPFLQELMATSPEQS